MDIQTLTALAESLRRHVWPCDWEDLGPYLDAACEAIEQAGGRVVVVAFLGTVKGWRFTAGPPLYDPPIEAPAELSLLIQILAGMCTTESPQGSSVSSSGHGEFVIDSQRRPRATFHELARWYAQYPLASAADVLRELNRSGIHTATCTFGSDDGLRFTSTPQPFPGWVDLDPPVREMIRFEIQEILNQATWPLGASEIGRSIRICYWAGEPRVEFRAGVRCEALVWVN